MTKRQYGSREAYLISRAPSFLVLRGRVYWNLGGKERLLDRNKTIQFNRHGRFNLRWAEDDWAVIEHITGKGARVVVFIPPQRRMYISNGFFTAQEVNYQSFLRAHDAGILVT